jgi:hypothetical protein
MYIFKCLTTSALSLTLFLTVHNFSKLEILCLSVAEETLVFSMAAATAVA